MTGEMTPDVPGLCPHRRAETQDPARHLHRHLLPHQGNPLSRHRNGLLTEAYDPASLRLRKKAGDLREREVPRQAHEEAPEESRRNARAKNRIEWTESDPSRSRHPNLLLHEFPIGLFRKKCPRSLAQNRKDSDGCS